MSLILYLFLIKNTICVVCGHQFRRYNKQEVCPLKISDNNITVYDKPDGEIILTGTYSGDHRNWSIEIETKSGIFSSYDSDTINLINMDNFEVGINVELYHFSNDNYQEIVEELEKMNS